MGINENYMEARIELNGAMEKFVETSRRVGFDERRIAEDFCDVAYEATGGKTKLAIQEITG